MTLLKTSCTLLSRTLLRGLVFTLCVCLPLFAAAQTEKKISYAVAVPGARAAASSAASAPVVRAPTPIIRPLEAAATPPVRAKTPTKPAAVKPIPKPAAVKKAPTKSAATSARPKPAAVKLPKKPPAAPSAAAKKAKPVPVKPAAKAVAPKKVTPKPPASGTVKRLQPAVATNSEPLATYPEPRATYPEPRVTYPEPRASNSASRPSYPEPQPEPNRHPAPLATLAPVAVAAVAAAATVSAEEEQDLARSLAEEGDYLNDPDTVAPAATLPATLSRTNAPVAVVPSAPPSPVPATPLAKTTLPMSNQREAFVSAFKNFVETTIVPKTPGLALAVIADGKVKVLQTYGVKQVGSNSPINADTTFRLASVSKSFGATAAAMMVNDGLIRWDTKVTSLLPTVEFSNPRYGDQLTVQNILSQATGLPTQTNSNFIEEGLSFDEVVYRLRFVNFVCPPGKCYNYQNVTYSLISNIVLKKTGMTYEQYLEHKIFNPLGMRTATVGFKGYSVNGNYALPHLPTRKGWAPTNVTEHYYRVNPAAGVNASISDMSRWVLAHMGQNPSVLPPSILNAVHAKVTRNTPAQNHYGSREGVTDSHYGLGWRVFDYRGDKNFIHHGGGVKGFRSEVVFNPELKIGMVILTNGPRLSGSVIFEFLDAYEDEKRGERRPQAAAPVKQKKK